MCKGQTPVQFEELQRNGQTPVQFEELQIYQFQIIRKEPTTPYFNCIGNISCNSFQKGINFEDSDEKDLIDEENNSNNTTY